MPDLRPEDRWHLLLDKARRGPFGWINRGPFFSRPTLSSLWGFFSIGESRGLRWMGVVFWPTFVVPVYVAFWTLVEGNIPFAARLVRAGLQICSQNYDEKALPQWLPYELNLVLRQPPGERITLLDAHGRDKINRLARRLGEFLDLPVWDHAEIGKLPGDRIAPPAIESSRESSS